MNYSVIKLELECIMSDEFIIPKKFKYMEKFISDFNFEDCVNRSTKEYLGTNIAKNSKHNHWVYFEHQIIRKFLNCSAEKQRVLSIKYPNLIEFINFVINKYFQGLKL